MKFTNVKQLIIKFMGGGIINFPTRFLRWVKINGDNDSDDSFDNEFIVTENVIKKAVKDNYEKDTNIILPDAYVAVNSLDENDKNVFQININIKDVLKQLYYYDTKTDAPIIPVIIPLYEQAPYGITNKNYAVKEDTKYLTTNKYDNPLIFIPNKDDTYVGYRNREIQFNGKTYYNPYLFGD